MQLERADSGLSSPESRTLGVRKGSWTEEEDDLLRQCVDKFGACSWHQVPLRAGLNRCRKSCRLRWLNYLKPNIKRGHFTADEIDLLIRLHKLLGNRWSLIAGRLPGRTANDVKNYWNTRLCRRLKSSITNAHDTSSTNKPTPSPSTLIKPRPRTFKKITSWPTMACQSPPELVDEPLTSIEPADDTSAAWWESLLFLEQERESVCCGSENAGRPESWAGPIGDKGNGLGLEEKFGSFGDNGPCDSGDEFFADVCMWDDVLVPEINQ